MSLLAAFALAAAAPSFDCARATSADEKAICATPELAEADALMARLYAKARVSAFGTGPSGQAAAQATWLKQRVCKPDKDWTRTKCLAAHYKARNHELATAIAVSDPDLALPVIRALDPEGAALTEAIVTVARRDPGAPWPSAMSEWRPRLAQLLMPYAVRLFTTDDWRYGRDILSDQKIATIEQALASEASFASFVQVTSAYLPEDGEVDRALPCAAAVRHPGLLAATEALFGSTIDNFILTSDCEVMLPPTPALNRLSDAIWGGWPACEGTIRFSAYRAYAVTMDQAQLGIGKAGKVGAQLPAVRGVPRRLVDAAIAELAAYYVRYGRAERAASTPLARAKVAAILGAAHNCND